MDHEWGGWPEDESELHGSLGGDADTADLTDSGAGLTELDGGHDYVDDATTRSAVLTSRPRSPRRLAGTSRFPTTPSATSTTSPTISAATTPVRTTRACGHSTRACRTRDRMRRPWLRS